MFFNYLPLDINYVSVSERKLIIIFQLITFFLNHSHFMGSTVVLAPSHFVIFAMSELMSS